jgi:hypothetical protein
MPFDESGEAIAHVREICLSLPDAVERLSHGSPTFFIGGKKTFVMFLDDHHGDGRLALWCAAEPGVQATLVDEEPDRFFVPPYVGHRGWIGVRLDRDVDWDEIAGVAEDAYRAVAPKRLLAALDQPDRPLARTDDGDS